MEKIDFTAFSTIDLVVEIVDTAQVMEELVLAEQRLTAALKFAQDLPGTEEMVIQGQALYDQMVCHRREGTRLLIEMTEEYNSRPDRVKDLPISPALRKMAVA